MKIYNTISDRICTNYQQLVYCIQQNEYIHLDLRFLFQKHAELRRLFNTHLSVFP